MHAVEARLEVGLEIVDIGERKAGVEVGGFVAAVILVEEVVVEDIVALGGVDIPQGQFAIPIISQHTSGVAVGEGAAVHLHGEEADAGMAAVGVELIVEIVGRVGLEAHGEGLGDTGIPELVLHVHAGESVVHQADGQHLSSHADVGLLQGDEQAALGVVGAVVGLGRQRTQRQQHKEYQRLFHINEVLSICKYTK